MLQDFPYTSDTIAVISTSCRCTRQLKNAVFMLNYLQYIYVLSDGYRIAFSQCRDPRIKGKGILLANPALAELWRIMTSLFDAAAAVRLKGKRIQTQGMMLRLTSGTAVEEDTRTAETALKVLTMIPPSKALFSTLLRHCAGSKRQPLPSGRHATRATWRTGNCCWSRMLPRSGPSGIAGGGQLCLLLPTQQPGGRAACLHGCGKCCTSYTGTAPQ